MRRNWIENLPYKAATALTASALTGAIAFSDGRHNTFTQEPIPQPSSVIEEETFIPPPLEPYTPPPRPWEMEPTPCSEVTSIEKSIDQDIVIELNEDREDLLALDRIIQEWKEVHRGIVKRYEQEQVGVVREEIFDREEPYLSSEPNYQGRFQVDEPVRFHSILERVKNGQTEQWIILPSVTLTHHCEGGNYKRFTVSYRFLPKITDGKILIDSLPTSRPRIL